MPMSNESTPQVPGEQPKPVLPQFDPRRPAAADDTQQLPSAATSELPVTPPATPYAYAASPSAATPLAGPGVPLSPTGLPARQPADPAANGSRWSAKKTAVTAGLALLLTSAGAIGAAAALASGSSGDDGGFRGPGGGRTFHFPGGQRGLQNQQGTIPQQLPNLQSGVPGGGLGNLDPNQLSQLDPQDLLQQLGQDSQGGPGIDPFSDDQGQGQDGQGSRTSDGARTT